MTILQYEYSLTPSTVRVDEPWRVGNNLTYDEEGDLKMRNKVAR